MASTTTQPKEYEIIPGKPFRRGFGLMGFTWLKGSFVSEDEAIDAMKAAYEGGARLWNSAEFYGPPDNPLANLHLIAKYFAKYPEHAPHVTLVVKGCVPHHKPDSSPAGIAASIQRSLTALDGKKSIDVFEPARIDTSTPIEDSMRAFAAHIASGDIGAVGLSEVGAATLRRAAAVPGVKVAAIEVEVSLWSTDIFSNGVLAACRDNHIAIQAYAPLGRGFLTGQIRSRDDLADNDFRKNIVRFSAENFGKNIELVDKIVAFAKAKGCTPAQLAIGWLYAVGAREGVEMTPIFGASTRERVQENLVDVQLDEGEMKEIQGILDSVEIVGSRYPPGMEHTLFR